MRQNPRYEEGTGSFQDIIAYCCGQPQGDELPQIASEDDIAVDIYHDVTSMTREQAMAYLHHQTDNDIFH